LSGVCLAGSASATTYVCSVKPDSKGAWIPQTLAISHTPSTGEVIVNDDMIMQFRGKPLAGKVAVDNKRRITFTWTIDGIEAGGGQSVRRFDFRATIQKGSHKISMTSQPSGFANVFGGRGACKVK
jgi:hypothetical protein